MTIAKFLEETAKQLATELGEKYNLPYTVENYLLVRLALRDAEILAKIAIGDEKEEADTIPPEKDNEVTKIDNSL